MPASLMEYSRGHQAPSWALNTSKALLRSGNGDRSLHDVDVGLLSHRSVPFVGSGSFSAAAANATSAVSHIRSRYWRMAATPDGSTR